MAVTNLGDEAATRTDTSDPYNMAITVPANCRGIGVGLSHGTSSTDHVVSVTFDGVTFTRIVRATDTTTEPGDAILYFGAKNTFTSGAGTLVVDLASATGDDIHINVWYAGSDASASLTVVDFDSISENAANPTATLQKGGRSGLCVCQMYGGGAAPGGTLAAGNTLDGTVDHTAFYSQACHETTIDTADHTIGWSTLAGDDLAFVAMCIAEAATTSKDGSLVSGAVLAGVQEFVSGQPLPTRGVPPYIPGAWSPRNPQGWSL